MNRKLIVGIVLIAVLGIGILAFLALQAIQSRTTITQKIEVPASFVNAAPYDDTNLLYPGLRTLVTYNVATGQSSKIGPDTGDDGLKNADSFSVSGDKKFVLFRDSYATPGGLLASKLAAASLDNSQAYWWIYNTETQTYAPIPLANIMVAKFDGTNVYALTTTALGNSIATFDRATLKPAAVIPIISALNFFVVPAGFLLQTSDGNVYLTKDGVTNTFLLSSTTIVGIAPDQQSALAVENAGKSPLLERLSLQDYSAKGITKNVTALPTWNDSGKALYSTGDPQNSDLKPLYIYDLVTNKNTTWKLSKDITGKNPTALTAQVLLNDSTAIVSNSSGTYFLLGNAIHAFTGEQ